VKGKDVFAIVPRRLPRELLLKDVRAAGATLIETGDKLAVRTTGGGLAITIPDALRDRLPERVAHCIRLSNRRVEPQDSFPSDSNFRAATAKERYRQAHGEFCTGK